MMNDFVEWILSRMRLVDEDDPEEQGTEVVSIEKEPEEIYKKKNRRREYGSVYCKVIRDYEDCNQGIEYYRMGATCIYIMDSLLTTNEQNLLNYLCGGIFALGGEICAVSKNIFITQKAR